MPWSVRTWEMRLRHDWARHEWLQLWIISSEEVSGFTADLSMSMKKKGVTAYSPSMGRVKTCF